MAKYSQKLMGKEVGDASVYAEPHTMTGKKVKAQSNPGKPTELSDADTMHMSVGVYNNRKNEPGIKTSGIKMRGAGCATKGTMSRGPMA
jgi:hypothetical protein